jgi:Rrf2 family nitric oxide-sensitive transcriptional repressor
MQLSQFSDYSLRALIYLALAEETDTPSASGRDIAERYGISLNHVAKVLNQLARLGYLDTQRGRGGGVRLAKRPESISVGAVVRQTEGGFSLVECMPPRTNACCIAPVCRLKGVFREARDAFLGVLDRYTIADLTEPSGALRAALQLA